MNRTEFLKVQVLNSQSMIAAVRSGLLRAGVQLRTSCAVDRALHGSDYLAVSVNR